MHVINSRVTPDNVAVLDAAEIDALPSAVTDEERRRRCWVSALARFGASHFIDNAEVSVRGLALIGRVLPLVVADSVAGNADVCSSFNHYLAYTQQEWMKRHPKVPSYIPHALVWPLQAGLAAGRIDRAVFVNNWLFATNPSPALSGAEIEAITVRLAATFPDHAIVLRGMNPLLDPGGMAGLTGRGYQLVRSRRVYVVNPRDRRCQERENVQLDRALLRDTEYRLVTDAAVLGRHAHRLAELYRGLYINKHSRLNPQFNERFFAQTLADDVLSYRALIKDGRIDGFLAFYEEDGLVTGAVLAYDRTLPAKTGLYRMLFAWLLSEAERRGSLANLSAGADRFKVLRGGMPVEEYDAVYTKHLAAGRRVAWSTLRATAGVWAHLRRPPEAARKLSRLPPDWNRVWPGMWMPHPRNPWFQYQAAMSARWVNRRGIADLTGQRLLKTDAFDEACGFDPLTALYGTVRRVVIDIAPRIATAALSTGARQALCVADVRALAFRPASFDLVFSPSTLDHFTDERDIPRSLRQLWLVLRPGGRLLLTLDNPSNPIVAARNHLHRRVGPLGPLIPFPMGRTLSRRRLAKILRRHGFTVIRTGFIVHMPRVVGLWLGEWMAQHGTERGAAWLEAAFEWIDRLCAWLPTRSWTGHYVIAECLRPSETESSPGARA